MFIPRRLLGVGPPPVPSVDPTVPRAGMDPKTRRAMWHYLSAKKAGRAIVLTTHVTDCHARIVPTHIVLTTSC